MKLLVTGFEPYAELAENPSATIVRELSRRATLRPSDYPELRAAILPTEFGKAERAIRELLQSDIPDVLLALGVAPRAQGLRLERTARNRDDATLPDNAGEQRTLTPIVPGGPDTFESTLPLHAMRAALEQLDMPVSISDDAGGYVCNHLFYTARQFIDSRGLPTRCGFVHIPLCTEQVDTQGSGPAIGSLPRAKLVEAVECCIRVIHSMGVDAGSRSMGKVVAVTELELADGVEAERFERFALDEYLPAVASLGVTTSLLCGNRGERDRGFLLLEEFESVEHRNQLFPGSETPCLAVAHWIETHQELVKAWNAQIASAHLTHYEVRGGGPITSRKP